MTQIYFPGCCSSHFYTVLGSFFNHLSFQIISVPMQPNNIWHFARKKSERNALGFEFDGRGFCTAGNTKGFYIELILLINWIFDQWEEF